MNTSSVLDENVSQWCNGHYELIYSCLLQLDKLRKFKKSENQSKDDKTGFIHRFWNKFRSIEEKVSETKHLGQDKDVESDVSDGLESFYDSDVDINSIPLEALKAAVKDSISKSLFHKPRLIPKRRLSLNSTDLTNYVKSRFEDLLDNVDNIDHFSQLANVDQYLCCELLYEGICYYGVEEAQKMAEFAIVENMLFRQSRFQLRSIIKLFSFVNISPDSEYIPDTVFPEALEILKSIISGGLIRNICMLILGTIKEASRYRSLLVDSEDKTFDLLHDNAIDLMNTTLEILHLYFWKFQATEDDISCVMSLVPHLLDLYEVFNLSEFSSTLSTLFKGYEDEHLSSLYPPSLGVASLWPSVKEFDDSSNSLNLSKKFSLMLIEIFNPGIYRFDSAMKISTLVNTNFVEKLKKPPFRKYNDIDLILDFVINGVFLKDLNKIIAHVDAGIFGKMRDFVDTIDDPFKRSCSNTIKMVLEHLFFHNGSLGEHWFSVLDYEIKCKHTCVDLSRCPRKDSLDESIYREPGKSLIEIMELISKLGIRTCEDIAFSVWRSCAESYKSVVPKPQCLVYKCRNSDFEGVKVDDKMFERLTTPENGFCWWERNNTLLELVATASDTMDTFVETYPKLLTCILEFGLLVASNSHSHYTRKSVGNFLSSGASRDLQFPFLLERVVLQIKSLANGCFDRLPDLIYERIIARDDQIETAEAAIQIASSIPSKFPRKLPLDGSCLTKLYTFPLIHSPNEVKVALCSLGLGGNFPFGLFDTASAAFKLVSVCNPIPQQLTNTDMGLDTHLSLNVCLETGDRGVDLKFLDMLFSILSRKFIKGSEKMISSALEGLCSVHICNSKNTVSALEKISELLYDDKSALGRLKNGLGVPELVSLMRSLTNLLLFLPKNDRFKITNFDWLYKLVKISLSVLDLYCLHNAEVDWSLVYAVMEFLLLVSKGPIASRNSSKATEHLLEQFLIPGSTLAIAVVRAAKDAKILPAISLICVIFKRDILLIVAHRTALFLSNNKGGTCPSCNKLSQCSELKRKQETQETNTLDWLPLKIKKLSDILSFYPRNRPIDEETCECINIDMHPISLQMAHDAIMEALASLRDKNDALTFNRRCDFIGSLEYRIGYETRIRSLFILIQMVERIGIDSLFLSDNVVSELQRVFNVVRSCKEYPEFINDTDMESEDLILYNKLSVVNNSMNYNMEIENIFFSFGHLTDLNRHGYDDLFYHLLYRCSIKDFCHRLGQNIAESIIGSDSNIISLIKLCRDGDVWYFDDWKRIDAFYSLISFVKKVPRVRKLVLKHWPNITSDVHKIGLSALDYNAFIVQALRLSNTIHLLSVIYENSDFNISFNDDMLLYVKLCLSIIKITCDTQTRIYASLLNNLGEKLTKKDDSDLKLFLNCWQSCGFSKHIYEIFPMRICTKILNKTSAESFGIDKEYVDTSALYNIFTCSSASLLASLVNFISQCYKFKIKDIENLSRNWLELASVEFNPDERSELKLTLQITLIKKLANVWIKTNVGQKHDDALFSVSIVLKLVTFVLTRRTSTHLRSKVYSCVNLLLSNKSTRIKIAELLVAHLLSQMFNFSNTSSNNRLLQLLFSDASFSHLASEKNQDDSHEKSPDLYCMGIKTNNYIYKDFSSIILGEDYSAFSTKVLAGKSQGEILELGYILSNENFHISIDGSSVDCRLEALKLLSSILLAIRRFEASSIEYDTGTLNYGSLGALSLKQISLVIQNRLVRKEYCKKCQLHPPYCPLCLDLVTGSVSVLESASKLHQFSSFWFHTNPILSVSLSDSLLLCDTLVRYTDFSEKLPVNLVLQFMVILEHFLNSPSIKTKNKIVSWLNRHSELLSSFITKTIETGLTTEVVTFISSFLRVYRISLLWLLSEYRSVEIKETYKDNFSLVLAELNCKFPLAISVPKLIPDLLGALTSNIDGASEQSWLCILLSLQTFFPELGAFEINFDVSTQIPIKILALERCGVIFTVLNTCGNSLVNFIRYLGSADQSLVRHEIHRLALRVMTIDCLLVLLEYIFSLVVDKNCVNSKDIANIASGLVERKTEHLSGLVPKLYSTNVENITHVLDQLAQVCKNNGASLTDKLHGGKHSIVGASLEFLHPHELEHVPSLGSTHEATYSYRSLLVTLFSSVCNLAVILEKHYGCKFISHAINNEIHLENNGL
ncbi:conserved hypothetical protein [Theileria equi strain WA]|uniref:Uncharacterized protein n=1 Tax=Theileria equi strain WA TaxID=1537102 RepID=L1LD31_THEEQ|nr:conserved hypothetical protein [Theileria equi strain WA]EKX73160.1 conserved hypothetical protein [Theileria equi strain WA]|eukprot:XP_004832612.1 conserved hypothetical protein [Theileria equi strain WA]